MPKSAFNWKVAGAAGEGIKSTGLMFSKTCLRQGLFTFDYTEYPSLIRGGHNTYQVVAGTDKVYAPEKTVDVLIALNQNAVKFHHTEVTSDGIIVYDGTDGHYDLTAYPVTAHAYNVPLVELAKAAGGERVMANNVALGVSVYVLGLDLKLLNTVIADTFKGKKPEVVSLNQKAAQAGYEYARANLQPLTALHLPSRPQTDTISLTGNEALALGSIAGGMKAFVAYPMTPSSSILHALADWQEKANIFVKHAEDEIGVINMALGLSFAGIRTAVGTSGGGFCYMTEAVGLAGVAELPLVIFEAMRPGPALGMPTWTAQGDLLFAINASQDEFPRIVLAPGDVTEAFEQANLAFDLAEDFQIPVIVLSDKHLSESGESMHLDTTIFSHQQNSFETQPAVDGTGFYPRYTVTPTGVGKRSIPGQPQGLYLANSYEHEVHGWGSEEAIDRTAQMDKRMRKLDAITTRIPSQFYEGSDRPDITLIGFGSTKGAMRAAARKLQSQGVNAAVFNLSWMWPFPTEQVRKVLDNSACPVVIEGNHTHQLARLIREETGIDVYHKRVKYDGRPFYPDDIIGYTEEILGKVIYDRQSV